MPIIVQLPYLGEQPLGFGGAPEPEPEPEPDGLDFSALTALPIDRQSSAGWIDQATIDSFAASQLWLDAFSTFTDTAGSTPAAIGDPIAAVLNNRAGGLFTQANASLQPSLDAGPSIAGGHTKTIAGSTTATTGADIVIATNAGILVAKGDIPASFTIRNITNTVHWVSGTISTSDISRIKAFAVAEGAVDNDFAGVTNFTNYFRLHSFLTSFPLINTAAGTNFIGTWFGCSSLTSFPLINTSSGTNFSNAWRNCSSLATFPSNFFDGCAAIQFSGAFINTALTQTSIDNILVSINSNSGSGGTFDQSGGSAPSATGEAAIDAMRSRGWTVTVTGGY